MRVARSLILSALTAICCAGPRAIADPPTVVERKTAHYDLYLEGADADAVADLVEREYAVLAQFFGREPNARLTLKVYSSHERYVTAIKALSSSGMDRTVSPSGTGPADNAMLYGGWYNLGDKVAYAAEARGPYWTRGTILHECVHQFHFLAACNNLVPKSHYYVEGLAEHFAVHQWDGRSATLGKVPLIAARDDPAQALNDLRTQHRGGPRQLATGGEPLGPDPRSPAYGAGWGLVSFLIDRRPEQFRHWAAELDAQADPAAAWDHVFGAGYDDALTKEYEAWLLAHQEPWRAMSGDWQNTDERTFQCATSTPRGAEFAVLKAPVTTLRGSVSLDGDQAGVVVGYTSNGNYDVLFVSATGAPVHHKLREGKWTSRLPLWTTHVANPKKFSFEISTKETEVKITIDGQLAAYIDVPADSRIGLAAGGGATFSSVESH